MARRIPVADIAIAQAALVALLENDADALGIQDVTNTAAYLVAATSKVRFQPSTRQLVLTFDLGMGDQPEHDQQ